MKDFDEKYTSDELVKDRQEYKKDVFGENLKIELDDRVFAEEYGFDFVPRINHWTSVEEQKIQVDKMEDITDKK